MNVPFTLRPFIIFSVLITLIFSGHAVNAAEYDGLIVDKITVLSNEIPENKIVSFLGLLEGEPVTKELLRKGFKELHSTGVFRELFFDLKIIEVEGEKRVHLTIIVDELFKIKKINFIGNQEYTDDVLIEEVPAKIGDYYTDALMRQVKLFIQGKYREDGYLMTDVLIDVVEFPDSKEVEITFDVTEGSEMLVGKINFHGNDNVTKGQLKQVMETKEDKWFREGKFDETVFEQDKEKLIARFKKDGYFKARIDKVRMTYRWKNPRKKRSRSINIDIWFTEGDAYYFGKTIIKGNKLFKTEEIKNQFRRYEGDLYDEEIHQADVERLNLMYHSRGYIFARLTPIEQVNEETKTIDYVFDIYEGDKAHIERILVAGNDKTKDYVIKREVTLREGEIFNSLKIRRSLEKLTRTQFFKNVVPEPKPGSIEGLMNLVFRVEEQQTGIISAGAGFGTTSGFSLNFEIRENNFLGRGWGVGAKVDVGLTRQVINLSFTEPYLLGEPISTRFSVSFTQIDQVLPMTTNGTAEVSTNDSGVVSTNFPTFSLTNQDDINELPAVYRDNGTTTGLPYKSANIGAGFNLGYRFGDWFNTSAGFNYNAEFQYWDNSIRIDNIHPKTQDFLWEKHQDKFQKDGERNGFALHKGLRRDVIHTISLNLNLSRDSRNDILEPHRGSYVRLGLSLVTLGYRVAKWDFHAEWNKTFLWKLTFHASTSLKTLGPLFGEGFDYPEDRYYFFFREELRGWSESHITSHRTQIALPFYNGGDRPNWNVTSSDLLAPNARGAAKIKHTLEIRWPFVEKFIGGSIFLDAGNLSRRELSTTWISYLYDPTIYLFSWGLGVRIHLAQFPIRFYFPWRFAYDPTKKSLEYWQMTEQNGLLLPDFVFTVAGFF